VANSEETTAGAPAAAATGADVAKLTGLEEYVWKSPDGRLECTYGRPSGFVSDTIDVVLGPEQVSNKTLWSKMYALAGIRTWTAPDPDTGERITKASLPPQTHMQFLVNRNRFETDDNYLDYVGRYHLVLNPEFAAALADAEQNGKIAPEQVAELRQAISDAAVKK
jgi:hypothetical protein